MFKNYFTIAFRTLGKNKVFTLINVLGLAIGISASLIIFLLVNYHFSFDRFEKDKDRIYRVVTNFNFSGAEYKNPGVTSPMGNAMVRELSGRDAVAGFRTWDGNAKISVPEPGKKDPFVFKKQKNIVFADESYFNLIGYTWVAGSAKTSLAEPYQTVLTVSNAKHFFPFLAPAQTVGKILIFNDTVQTVISGVVADITSNTVFSFTTFLSKATLEKTTLKPRDFDDWTMTNGASQLLVKLSPGSSVVKMETSITGLHKKYKKSDPQDHSITTFMLQPLQNIHFNSAYNAYDNPSVNQTTLYSLLLVATLLLLLACINFINLTTAQASNRAKETGVRKAMGSSRKQLVFQFLSETFVLTLSAAILSVLLAPYIIKAFSGFLPADFHFNFMEHEVLLSLLLLIVIITPLAGFYPALILSGYNPVMALKNQVFVNSGKTRIQWLRRSLTTAQFVIAQVFIMGVLLVSKQINYSLNKDLGFKKDAIVSIQTNYYDTAQRSKYVLMENLKAIPAISMISLSTSPPSSNNTWSGIMKYKDGKKEIETDVQQKYADTNYLHLYQIKLLAGANYMASDSVNAFVINETYLHTLGFKKPEDAIGKILDWSGKKIPIAGVVADFNQESLHEPIKSLAMGSWAIEHRTFNIALHPQKEPGDWNKTIAKIENAWKQVYPKYDFEYAFVDEDIAKYYKSETQLSSLLMWATGLMIFISCLGLLGLVIYTTTQRTKEIGIRKILGAQISQIVAMLSKEFVLLVLLAFLIAAPLAFFGMHKWLQNFAFKTDISWWVFILSAAGMILLALFTISIRTIRSALANPVKSLRSE